MRCVFVILYASVNDSVIAAIWLGFNSRYLQQSLR